MLIVSGMIHLVVKSLIRLALLGALVFLGGGSSLLAQERSAGAVSDSLSRPNVPVGLRPSLGAMEYVPKLEIELPRPGLLTDRPRLTLGKPKLTIPTEAYRLPPLWAPRWQSIRLDAWHRYDEVALDARLPLTDRLDLSGVLQMGVRQLGQERSYDWATSLRASYRLSDGLMAYAGARLIFSPWGGDMHQGNLGVHWRGGRWELGAHLDYTQHQWLGRRMQTLGLTPFLVYRISDRLSIHSATHLPLWHQGYQPGIVNSTVLKWRFTDRWSLFGGTETYFDIRTRRVVVRPTGGLEYDAGRR